MSRLTDAAMAYAKTGGVPKNPDRPIRPMVAKAFTELREAALHEHGLELEDHASEMAEMKELLLHVLGGGERGGAMVFQNVHEYPCAKCNRAVEVLDELGLLPARAEGA